MFKINFEDKRHGEKLMKYGFIEEYCLMKKAVKRDFKAEWNADRYMVNGKIFAMVGSNKHGRPIITLKLEPALGSLLREKYEDIVPGYYMNKEHWNSLYLDGNVPDEVLLDMLDKAYESILKTFSKKALLEILS